MLLPYKAQILQILTHVLNLTIVSSPVLSVVKILTFRSVWWIRDEPFSNVQCPGAEVMGTGQTFKYITKQTNICFPGEDMLGITFEH